MKLNTALYDSCKLVFTQRPDYLTGNYETVNL